MNTYPKNIPNKILITPPSVYTTWQEIDWGIINITVRKLQCKIYQASLSKDKDLVHKLQNKLSNSIEAKLMATKKITQDNVGKRSAGVDGIKFLKPHQRIDLAKSLELDGSSDPVRRIYIPKPGKSELRPLGIPTIKDRCKQMLAFLCLDPEWEALLENNSYGFRPGRSTHDAISKVRNGLKNNPKYVYDADIKGCFDEILHAKLIEKLATYPEMEIQIKSWLKSGVIEPGQQLINPTTKGTPQGGIISPLLANVALHGLETALQNLYDKRRQEPGKKSILHNQGKFTFAKYADDFIFAHPNFELLLEGIIVAKEFLKEVGLIINENKTNIIVTNERINHGNFKVGFDFLGCHFRLYNRKYRGTTSNRGKKKDFVLFVTPSKSNRLKHYNNLKKTIWSMKSVKQEDLIKRINPIIRGWSLYYQHYNSTREFSKLDYKLWFLLFNWANKRHSKKSKTWVINKYFHKYKNQNLRFLTNWNEIPNKIVNQHSDTKISQYYKCKADYSPYASKGYYNFFTDKTLYSKLHKKQEGICKMCNTEIFPSDILEVHHILPRSSEKRNNMKYIWLIHKSCHDQLHANTELLEIEEIETLESYDSNNDRIK